MPLSKKERLAIATEFSRRHGRYDPLMFLAEAKSVQHPAHSWFTWSDTEAAHQHRLWQARSFVKDLRIVIETKQLEHGALRFRSVEAPAFVSPVGTRQRGAGYLAVDPADRQAMAALREEAGRALAAWLRRYRMTLADLEGGGAAIETVIAALRAPLPADAAAA